MKRLFRFILGILVLAALIAAAIYCIPRVHSARVLHENGDMVHFTYEARIEFKNEALDGQVKQMITTCANLLGLPEEELYELTARGNVYENTIFAQIFTKGAVEPALELYLSEDKKLLNVTAFVVSFREKILALANGNPMMTMLLPEVNEEIYITTEQAKALFGIDLTVLENFSYNLSPLDLSPFECFVELLPMERKSEDDGCYYSWESEHLEAHINIPHGENALVTESLLLENPSEVIQDLEDGLKLFKVQIPTVGTEMMETFYIEVKAGEGEKIVIPEASDNALLNIFMELKKLMAG